MDKYPVAVGLAFVLSAARVLAAPSERKPLTVSLTGCPAAPIAANAFIAAIQVELDLSQRPILSRSELPAAISVRVDCGGRASIRIRIGNSEDQREVRVDDVPVPDRPRVLALVVAELVRSDAESAAAAGDSQHAKARAPASESKKTSARSAAAAEHATTEAASLPSRAELPHGSRLRPWIGASMHTSFEAPAAIYGAAAGVNWDRSRLQVEVGFARAERARGDITSGLAAARYRRSVHLTGTGTLSFKAALSSAAGVTWAVGHSKIPGVVVRRALLPYADARFELALQLWPAQSVAPELAVYAGGAVGLLATNVGESVLSSGGWLFGTSFGSTF